MPASIGLIRTDEKGGRGRGCGGRFLSRRAINACASWNPTIRGGAARFEAAVSIGGCRWRPAPRRGSRPGGELTLFEAVGRSGLISFCCVARRRSGMFGVI
jgi:hypothetical protein